jgi:quercetin dioxygenase-like cupin family protein
MRHILLALVLTLPVGGAAAAGAPVSTPIGRYTATNSGQPIMPPPGPVQVAAMTVEIPAGASLPVHRHPYQRYGYVLSGRIRVDNLDAGSTATYGPGDVIIEALGQWHTGTALGDAPVTLLVIDQVPPGVTGNGELKAP